MQSDGHELDWEPIVKMEKTKKNKNILLICV